MLAVFGFIPVDEGERQAERESWNLRRPMAPLDRMARQRGYLLYTARWILIILGGTFAVIGAVLLFL
jgi:hypothetical protein